jgi:hypothetical protein
LGKNYLLANILGCSKKEKSMVKPLSKIKKVSRLKVIGKRISLRSGLPKAGRTALARKINDSSFH